MDTSYLVLKNMIENGSVKSGGRTMSQYKLSNGTYKLEFNREEINYSFAVEDTAPRYKCNITFYDSIEREVFKFTMNEIEVFGFLDNLNEYMESWQVMDMILHPNIITLNPNVFQYARILLEYNNCYRSDPKHHLLIREVNKMFFTDIEKIHAILSDDDIYEIADLMYFSFLIDLSDSPAIQPLYAISNFDNLL